MCDSFETEAKRAVAYLVSRQCQDGGFCFYRSDLLEESNLADTCHVVAALGFLGHPIPREDRLRRIRAVASLRREIGSSLESAQVPPMLAAAVERVPGTHPACPARSQESAEKCETASRQ